MSGHLSSIAERLSVLLARPVSPDDRARARLHLLDWVGCTVAGAREADVARVRGLARAEGTGASSCWAPVRTLKEAFDDPALVEREMLAQDADGNEIVGTPIRFREEPAVIDPTVPSLDGHGADIRARLGCSAVGGWGTRSGGGR